jgi:hypothetical protein
MQTWTFLPSDITLSSWSSRSWNQKFGSGALPDAGIRAAPEIESRALKNGPVTFLGNFERDVGFLRPVHAALLSAGALRIFGQLWQFRQSRQPFPNVPPQQRLFPGDGSDSSREIGNRTLSRDRESGTRIFGYLCFVPSECHREFSFCSEAGDLTFRIYITS